MIENKLASKLRLYSKSICLFIIGFFVFYLLVKFQSSESSVYIMDISLIDIVIIIIFMCGVLGGLAEFFSVFYRNVPKIYDSPRLLELLFGRRYRRAVWSLMGVTLFTLVLEFMLVVGGYFWQAAIVFGLIVMCGRLARKNTLFSALKKENNQTMAGCSFKTKTKASTDCEAR